MEWPRGASQAMSPTRCNHKKNEQRHERYPKQIGIVTNQLAAIPFKPNIDVAKNPRVKRIALYNEYLKMMLVFPLDLRITRKMRNISSLE